MEVSPYVTTLTHEYDSIISDTLWVLPYNTCNFVFSEDDFSFSGITVTESYAEVLAPNTICEGSVAIFQTGLMSPETKFNKWIFNDSTVSPFNPDALQFNEEGLYDILLETNNSGCGLDTVVHVLFVHGNPKKKGSSKRSQCHSSQSSFISDGIVSGAYEEWRCEDPLISCGLDTLHGDSIFFDPSTAMIGLNRIIRTITDSITACVSVDTFTYDVIAAPQPTIHYIIASSASGPGITMQFTGGPDSMQAYYWDFGDGHTDTVQNPLHTYVADSTYMVELRVVDVDSLACEASTTKAVVVENGQPVQGSVITLSLSTPTTQNMSLKFWLKNTITGSYQLERSLEIAEGQMSMQLAIRQGDYIIQAKPLLGQAKYGTKGLSYNGGVVHWAGCYGLRYKI